MNAPREPLFLAPGQLYALELRARRERAEVMGRMFVAAAAGLKTLLARAFALRGPSAADVGRQVARHA